MAWVRRPWSPFDSKDIEQVNPKENQPWIFIGRTDGEAEAPIIWPLDVKSRLTGKDPDAGRDWGQEEKGMMEDEMVEWHHLHNRHELEQTQGDGEGQGSLAFCSPWGHRIRHDLATGQHESEQTDNFLSYNTRVLQSWCSTRVLLSLQAGFLKGLLSGTHPICLLIY